jgi:hypothetical protein
VRGALEGRAPALLPPRSTAERPAAVGCLSGRKRRFPGARGGFQTHRNTEYATLSVLSIN